MRQRLLSYIRKHRLMRPGDRVGLAVSGGADSVALLRLLLETRAELGIVLSVVHFNHKIRGAEADADEQFVRELARSFDLEFHGDSADTPAFARQSKRSLEAAASELRYQFFWRLVERSAVHRVATAHTLDDQAETVLMRFLRGSGTRGLAAIHPELRLQRMYARQQIEVRELPIGDSPWIVRPLLHVSRAELRACLAQLGQSWREDASNADLSFARNRLRHQVIPLLRQLNANLDQLLSETAEIARAEEEFWSDVLRNLPGELYVRKADTRSAGNAPALNLDLLALQPLALQRRLVRHVAEIHGHQLEFRHVEEVLALAFSEPARSEKIVELPHDWEAVRQDRELCFRRRCQTEQQPASYDVPLPVPGEADVAGRKVRAALVNREQLHRDTPFGSAAYVTQVLLDPALAARALRVRNWCPGDRYRPAHTREPKKLKELLQARHIPREQKPYWPVVVSGDEIIWVPGFAAQEQFRVPDESCQALLLQEVSPDGG